MYDFAIIGSGISGLYAAYQLKKQIPPIHLCILEKEKRIGGRMGNEDFHGISVPMGAGVGRKKDLLLIQLLEELHISYTENETHIRDLNPHPISVMETIRKLRSQYRAHPSSAIGKTFREFAIEHLGKDIYDSFIISAGYTDYEKEDVFETLYHYGMEDNEPGWTSLSIPWNDVLHTLIRKIGISFIHTKTEIIDLKKIETDKEEGGEPDTDIGDEDGEKEHYFQLTSVHGKIWKASNVIIATQIYAIQHLIHGSKQPNSLYQQIHSQHFLRVYAKCRGDICKGIMKQYIPMTTVLPGPIHKIIPMSPEKGIYMIAYTDNQSAFELKKYSENTEENRKIWARKLESCFHLEQGVLEFEDIRSYYWDCGTHYFSPFQKTKDIKNRADFIRNAQRPMKGVWVVGEMISTKQGWVEGALESVHAVL